MGNTQPTPFRLPADIHMPCGCPYPKLGDHRPCEHGYPGDDDSDDV
jgi:hypothetical protein